MNLNLINLLGCRFDFHVQCSCLVLLVAVSKNAAIENVHNEPQEEAVSTEASVSTEDTTVEDNSSTEASLSTEDTTVEDNSYHIYTSQFSGLSLKVKKANL